LQLLDPDRGRAAHPGRPPGGAAAGRRGPGVPEHRRPQPVRQRPVVRAPGRGRGPRAERAAAGGPGRQRVRRRLPPRPGRDRPGAGRRPARRFPRAGAMPAPAPWLAPHPADVSALLRDRRFGRTYLHVASHAEMGRPEEPAYLAPFWHLIRNGMLDLETPDHTRLRRLMAKAFTPRMVERLRPRVQERVDRLVDDLAEAGGGDLVAGVAEPLSGAGVAHLRGVPEAARPV